MFNKVDVSGDSVVQMYDTSGGERFMRGPFILRFEVYDPMMDPGA